MLKKTFKNQEKQLKDYLKVKNKKIEKYYLK